MSEPPVDMGFNERDIEYKDALYDDKFAEEIKKNVFSPSIKNDVDNPGSKYMINKLRRRILFRNQGRTGSQVALIKKARASYTRELEKYSKSDSLTKLDKANIADSKLRPTGPTEEGKAEDAKMKIARALASTDRIPALSGGV